MNTQVKWNGHTHTNFCRHGSAEPISAYLDEAVRQGFTRYSITEHPPLPPGLVPDAPLMRELAMDMEELPHYLRAAHEAKALYAERLEVVVGLELDYLENHQAFSEDLLDRTAGKVEDLVVSVHFLPGRGGMRCLDYRPLDFQENILAYYGSMNTVVHEYYDRLEQAIRWAGTLPGRKRLGHPGLINKFRTVLPKPDADLLQARTAALLPLLQEHGVGLDINTAGLRVQTCGQPYVPEWLIRDSLAAGVECVFGSDAHRPEDVGSGWAYYKQATALDLP